jgi:hypothetical protein
VCRFWLRVIQASVEFEYQIELEAHGKIDGGHASTVSIPDRLQALRKHLEAWSNLSWSTRDKVALDDLLPRLPNENLEGFYRHIVFDGLEHVSLHGPSTLAQDLSPTYPRGGCSLHTTNLTIDAEQGVLSTIGTDS